MCADIIKYVLSLYGPAYMENDEYWGEWDEPEVVVNEKVEAPVKNIKKCVALSDLIGLGYSYFQW